MTGRPGEAWAENALSNSFRDPGGAVIQWRERIFRIVNDAGWRDWQAFSESPVSSALLQRGAVVSTEVLGSVACERLLREPEFAGLYERIDGRFILEHERIAFPSYPYEWPPEMLHAAGRLTLDLARELLDAGLGLKDATPYNVLFRGPRPVFIDILSFERRHPGDATWLPYAQFVRTFLLPLLVNRLQGTPLGQIFLSRRDGLEPEEVYRALPRLDRLRPVALPLVSLPKWLGARRDGDDQSIYRQPPMADTEKARFVLDHLLGRTTRTLEKLAPAAGRASAWSNYLSVNNNYTGPHFEAKERFVRQALDEFRPHKLLDAGCNTGHFSAIAARAGAQVVAIDYDPVVAGAVWRMASAENLDIQPLVVDLTRPTPGTGWNNREWPSFLDRARGRFDAVLMLALIHHMLVTERVPLDEILALAAGLTRGIAIIEFVSPEDSMFRRLARGRDHLHAGLTPEVFENAARRWFDIVRVERAAGAHRSLYLLKVKS